VTTGALLAVAIVAMAGWASNEVGVSAKSQLRPWIAIPADSQFSGDRHSRALLLSLDSLRPRWSDSGALAANCGDPNQTHTDERYIAIFDTDGFGSYYRASFDVRCESAWIDVDSALGTGYRGHFLRSHPPPKSYRANLRELTEIHHAWSDSAVWPVPSQADPYCMHGGNTVLQACVNGRHSLSRLGCNAAARKLQHALESRFPLAAAED
jgi:hypothetical protein